MSIQNYKTNIKNNAIHGISTGVSICADVVRGTMGPKGKNVFIEIEQYPYNIISNDGATCIDNIVLEDPLEKMGHTLIKQATDRSNKNAGDGSTTTVVLLDAILKEALKLGVSGIEIKRSLDECLPIIEKSIDDQKRLITPEDVATVATISGESEELGKTLGEIYKFIGRDGIVHLEASGTYQTSFNLIEGVRFFDTGYLSPFMVHDEQAIKDGKKETKAVYENPTILVTKRKIQTLNDINPLIEELMSAGKKDLVIFTDDMDSTVASTLVDAHRNKVLNVLIIKAPVIWKNYVFEDFARCVGATIVEDASGINFKNLPLSALGTCSKIVVDKDETVLIGIADISEHISSLKTDGTDDSLLRLSWLTTKTAILKLGANSETELTYLRLKAEDAINASRLALQDGVVAGGGVALLHVSKSLPDTVGGNILKQALKAPFNQIVHNAEHISLDMDDVKGEWGYDAQKDEVVNMWDAGIIDAAKVTKQAVRNAIGVASTILTGSVALSIPQKQVQVLPAKQSMF